MITGMTKREQVDLVARAAHVTARQARDAFDASMAVIVAGLLEDERVAVSGLGVFSVQHRRPRRVNNPHTGVMMDLPASAVVRFKPAPELRRRVQERHA
jgi:nucleoid DNA-binding protein